MERVNILYLITDLDIGGAEKALVRTVIGLDKRMYNPTVCCLRGRGPVAEEIESAGVPVAPLNMSGKFDLAAVFRLFRLLWKEEISIVHSYLYHANILGRIVGRVARVPIIISSERSVILSEEVVNKNTLEMGSRLRRLMNGLSMRLSDRVVTVSELVRETLIAASKIDPKRLVTIHSGVNLEGYQIDGDITAKKKGLGLETSAAVIGAIGRLDRVKGVEYLLRAAAKVIFKTPDAAFLIVGDGSQREALEQLARSLGISHRMVFTGQRDDVPELLSTMDVLVLPSLYEGLPNAVLEAMAAGKPVIATRVGGTPEVVEDKVTGLLVPPRDPEALAEAIIALIQDRERAEAMGQVGRARVEEYFSVERMIAETETLYEELIEEKMRMHYVPGQGWQLI